MAFIRGVCQDLGATLVGDLILAVDNEAAIDIAQNMGVTARNKHFTDAIHYFRNQVDVRAVTPVHVATDLQRADGFTKPLVKTKFIEWARWLVC